MFGEVHNHVIPCMYAAQQLLVGMATILDSKQDTIWQHMYMTQLAVMSNGGDTSKQQQHWFPCQCVVCGTSEQYWYGITALQPASELHSCDTQHKQQE